LKAVQWLQAYCQEKGLQVEVQSEILADREEANIIIRPSEYSRQGADFLLQSHIDTVEPGPFHAWSQTNFDPFNATIENGSIYGLGTAEVKLDLLCKIEALAHFKGQSQFKMDPVVVGTFGEETGMQGALRLIRKNKLSPKMALISEPSDLGVIIAGKGLANVEIRLPFSEEELQHRDAHDLRESTSTQTKIFKGKSTHSSSPQWGESAIRKLLDHLEQLPSSLTIMEIEGGTNFNSVPSHAFLEIDFFQNKNATVSERLLKIYRCLKDLEFQISQVEDDRFEPKVSTLSIGVIRTFKDHIYLSGTFRMLPSISQDKYEKWMKTIQSGCDQVGAQFRIVDYKKSFSTPENSILVKASLDALRALERSGSVITQSSTNEASLFSRIGIDCICFGPGKRENNIHTPH
jgi:succinyl-diaminopimelate desuccinylase